MLIANKCSVSRRGYAPGQTDKAGRSCQNISNSFVRAKGKKIIMEFLEGKFRKYFDLAVNKKGVTGENLLQILELRLDNVVYRLGLATSRPEARQLVRHGHFTVNGKKVNIPSYLMKLGDSVAVAEKSKSSPKIKAIAEITSGKAIPKWLELDAENLTSKIIALPSREDVDLPLKENLIVELYSK